METFIKYNRPKAGSISESNSNITSIVQNAAAEAQQQEPQLWKESVGANTLIPRVSLNKAEGLNSVAIGTQTETKNEGELAIGMFNDSTVNKTFFSVGDGTDDVHRHNLLEVRNDNVLAPSFSGASGTFNTISGNNATLSNYVYSPIISGYSGFFKQIDSNSGNVRSLTSNTVTVNNKLTTNQLEAVSGYIKTLLSDEITVDYLTVTKAAHFFKLIIDEIKATQGQVIITPANAVLDKVTSISGGWRCYYRAKDDDGKEIYNNFEVNDQVVCQTFNVATGTSYNVSNTYYWRKVTATGTTTTSINGETVDVHYFDLSSSDCDQYSISVPKVGDNCVQLGNRTDTTRQAAIIISAYNSQFLDKGLKAPSIVQYAGINNYDLSTHRLNVISNGLNEFKGSYNNNSGKNIETIITETATTLDGRITTVNNAVTANTRSISLLQQTDEQIKSTVSANTTSIGNLSNDLGTLSGTVNTNTTNISTLQQTANGLTSTVQSHTTSITNINSNINSLSGSVSSNTQNISTLQQTAQGLTSTVQSQTTKINTISGNVITNTNNISSLQQTANGLSSTVSSHTTSINSLSGTVGDITEDYVVHSELTQTAEQIELNVYNNLEKTGINITSGHITIDANNTEFTGNIVLSDPNEGIIINDNNGNPKINIQNNSLGTLANFDFGLNKGIKIQEDTTYNAGQTTVTHTFAAKTLGTLKVGQKLVLSNMGFGGYFNTNPFNTNVTSASYSYVVKCGSTTVSSKSGTATKNSDKWPCEWRIADNTLSSVSYNGTYTYTLTVTLNLAADSRSYTGKFIWDAYVNSYAPTTNIIRLATDGAVIAASDTQYNWFGSDLTQIRNGASAIRAYNGKLQRNSVNTNTTTFSDTWSDLSSTVPYRIVNTTTYTATTDDCLIYFSTVVGNNDAQRVLYLPHPSTCPGKFYFVKNGVVNNTITYVNGHGTEYLFVWHSETSKWPSIKFDAESEIFISCGLFWISFNCN